MSNLVKYVAYGLGGTTLLTGSFFLAAAITGTPLSSMKGVGGLFPKQPRAQLIDSEKLPEIETLLENDTRSKEQILDSARSPLTAFVLQDPFSAKELSELERRLQDKLYELEQRERALDEREVLLDQDAEHLERLKADFERLKSDLLNAGDEQRAKDEELTADRRAIDALKIQAFKAMAAQFEDGEAPDAAAQLLNVYSNPDDAAQVLKFMAQDRANEILAEVFKIDPEKHRDLSVMLARAKAK